jgi:glutathione S-transferase
MSQPSRALYIFLKMTGIPFESKEIALRKLEHMTDEYAQINPFKKVPVIDDSGFILTERLEQQKKKKDYSYKILFSQCGNLYVSL